MENYKKYEFMSGQPMVFAASDVPEMIGGRPRIPFDVAAVGEFLAAGIRQAIEDGDMGREYTDSVIEAYHRALGMIEGKTDPAADVLREILQRELDWIDKNA